ncbi:pilin [Hahella ganghwensis]|uniref:pilin n=1 Tax=Hahella ganghwensis TaxID=286420 RepID=UPI00036B39F7|nr:prepilin-type N-terminal cleavage/methylation domain-containing protein [Hahella ganghwensis]
MKKQQSGFTLIELVMVIVILGILAAFALPKFADLTGDARTASIEGLAGALKSAAAIARAEQLVEQGALGDSVTLDGQVVTMVNGYPTANAAGIGAAAGVDSADYSSSGGGTAGDVDLVYTINGYSGSNCQVTYTSANAATDNTAPITAQPEFVVVTTGC